MTIYVFDYYGSGNALREFYDNEIEAVSSAKSYIDNLSPDDIDIAQVFKLEAERDDLEDINIYETPHKIIWSY